MLAVCSASWARRWRHWWRRSRVHLESSHRGLSGACCCARYACWVAGTAGLSPVSAAPERFHCCHRRCCWCWCWGGSSQAPPPMACCAKQPTSQRRSHPKRSCRLLTTGHLPAGLDVLRRRRGSPPPRHSRPAQHGGTGPATGTRPPGVRPPLPCQPPPSFQRLMGRRGLVMLPLLPKLPACCAWRCARRAWWRSLGDPRHNPHRTLTSPPATLLLPPGAPERGGKPRPRVDSPAAACGARGAGRDAAAEGMARRPSRRRRRAATDAEVGGMHSTAQCDTGQPSQRRTRLQHALLPLCQGPPALSPKLPPAAAG